MSTIHRLTKLTSFVLAAALTATLCNPMLDKLLLPKPTQTAFDPNTTDVMGYEGMRFLEPHVKKHEVNLGFAFAAIQCLPKWMRHLLEQRPSLLEYLSSGKNHQEAIIDILDARKDSSLTFEKVGFTILKMGKPSQTNDFRSATDLQHYYDELRPKLLELFPGASRIEIFQKSTIIRGGSQLRDQPASVNENHLDYSQNDTARQEFNQAYPVNPNHRAPQAVLGKLDTDKEEFRAMIGVWKPVYMTNPICDHPLAVMDARTFDPQDERPAPTHINLGGLFQYNQLLGKLVHNRAQKWFYYPFQEETEVLVFTHYTRGKWFANPHGSFVNPNCPGGYQTRVSVEFRAAVFYPKDADTTSRSNRA